MSTMDRVWGYASSEGRELPSVRLAGPREVYLATGLITQEPPFERPGRMLIFHYTVRRVCCGAE
jgi:hypothetical protein